MGIASSVTTAALAALAAVGGIVTFVAGKYHELGAFYALIGISATLFVFAIVVGAQGTAEVTKEGYKGSWSPFTKKKLFNWQANITMAAFAFFVLAIVVGLLSPAIPAQAPASAATPKRSHGAARTPHAGRSATEGVRGHTPWSPPSASSMSSKSRWYSAARASTPSRLYDS